VIAKRLLIGIGLLMAVALGLTTSEALASCHGNVFSIDAGIKCAAGGLDTNRGVFGPGGFFTRAVEVVILLTGAVAVLFVVIGGLRYVLSSGDPKAAGQAKDTIMFALIGIAVAAAAYAMVRFVINRF
jgi:hypothetical protein